MLNNLTNFFNLIKGRKIKTTLADSDLIPIGVRDPRFDGNYQPSAIEFADLQAQVGGLQTVAVDGVTITGNGTPASPLVANIPSVAIPYSNVIFVDAVNGNDGTGAMNRFDKPYSSVSTAISAASSLPGLSIDNRALVYIRRGQYVNPSVSLATNVDVYCEPGVVFTGTVYIRDWGVAVNANIYGNLKIDAWASTVIPFDITGASTITFEFDWISSQAAAIAVSPVNTGGRVTINGNYIYSSTIGQGFGITIRYAANVVMNIANAIDAPHSVFAFRYYTGTTTINCPNINMVSGNAYGGNYKHALIVYDASSTGNITVNGNINDKDTVYYGGIASMVRLWSNPAVTINITSNITSVWNPTLVLGSGSSNVTYSGKIITTREAIYVDGNTNLNTKNATIVRTTDTLAGPIGVYGNGTLYLNDTTIYSSFTNGNIINIESNTAKLYIKDVTAQGVGTGYFINVGSATPTTGVLNAYSTNANHPSFVNAYISAGSFIQDAAINTPKF